MYPKGGSFQTESNPPPFRAPLLKFPIRYNNNRPAMDTPFSSLGHPVTKTPQNIV